MPLLGNLGSRSGSRCLRGILRTQFAELSDLGASDLVYITVHDEESGGLRG